MANGGTSAAFSEKEASREDKFNHVWTEELNDVFADVASYYDRANRIAAGGMWNYINRTFLSILDVKPNDSLLDVCGGTNAVGIAALKKEPTLKVTAIDRSEEMQKVGQQRARAAGFEIESVIDDVHHLPFPDNSFDAVTLQFASRHLRVIEVFSEIHRVLKPGGRFYHSDMLRPPNKLVETMYYMYLRFSLTFTARMFNSSEVALNCRRYFIEVLSMFYSAEELSALMRSVGFTNVTDKKILFGMLAFHRAEKPEG